MGHAYSSALVGIEAVRRRGSAVKSPPAARKGSLICWLLAAPLLLLAGQASADLIVGPNCQLKTIQSAIDAVTPGFNIGVVPGTYSELININNKGDLIIYGGVNIGCGAGATGATVISGATHVGDSVVTVGGQTFLTLSDLTISDGNENSDGGHGGGIDFGGHGGLYLDAVLLSNNQADYGGGLDVTPDGPTEVVIFPGTIISDNTAHRDGGGIHIDGQTRLYITRPQTWIFSNHAARNGGGIDITGPARADIGSPGFQFIGFLPVIQNNDAQNGGGISALANTEDNQPAVVRLFSTDRDHPVTLQGNFAKGNGGGVYLKPWTSGIFLDGADANAALCAYNFRIVDNAAQDGSAIYSAPADVLLGTGNGEADVFFNIGGGGDDFNCNPEPISTFGGVATCNAGAACNEIAGNEAVAVVGGSSVPTDGSTVAILDESSLKGSRFSLHGNSGGHAFRVAGGSDVAGLEVVNCLIADNAVTQELIRVEDEFTSALIDSCTLAHNTIGAGHVIHADADSSITLTNSIVAEDGKLTLDYGGSGAHVEFVLSNDISTLPGFSALLQGDPKFVDVAAGDYHLRQTSPAIDFAPALSTPTYGNTLDLDGNARSVNLPGVPFNGSSAPRDLGAYELQHIDLIFGSDFE